MLAGYLAALGLTLIIEVPVYSTALAHLLAVPRLPAIAAGVLLNLVSHPLAFLVLAPLLDPPLGHLSELAVIEPLVCLLEAAMLYAWLRRESMLLLGISFVANGASLAAGLLVLR